MDGFETAAAAAGTPAGTASAAAAAAVLSAAFVALAVTHGRETRSPLEIDVATWGDEGELGEWIGEEPGSADAADSAAGGFFVPPLAKVVPSSGAFDADADSFVDADRARAALGPGGGCTLPLVFADDYAARAARGTSDGNVLDRAAPVRVPIVRVERRTAAAPRTRAATAALAAAAEAKRTAAAAAGDVSPSPASPASRRARLTASFRRSRVEALAKAEKKEETKEENPTNDKVEAAGAEGELEWTDCEASTDRPGGTRFVVRLRVYASTPAGNAARKREEAGHGKR